ncbi:MAG: hypothetical protein JWM27_3959 [Gemmatimonadetes bacterium]|nr:hypothetical protein [Gemmatimonadota bacterium]
MRSLIRLALLCIPAALPAQSEVSDSVRLRNACRQAVQVITSGHPAPHQQWAWELAPFCGHDVYVRLVVDSIRRTRLSADLHALGPIWHKTLNVRDANLFGVLLEIGGDRSASTPARVLAFRSLVQLENPDWIITYANLTGGQNPQASFPLPNGFCSSGTQWRPVTVTGRPLPSDWHEKIQLLRVRILADPNEPEDVRTAAACS